MTERRAAILVVDGEESRRAAMLRLLRDCGYAPSEAVSGRQALDSVRAAAPAVMVIGATLPDVAAADFAMQVKLTIPGTLVLQFLATAPDTGKSPTTGAGDGASGPNEAGEILLHGQKLEALGQLAGGIAHDFNNPLTIILGNMESLNRQLDRGNSDVARIRALADSAFNAGQRALGVTKRLIAFSRRQALDPKPINVNTLVTAMSDLFRRSLGVESPSASKPK